MSQKVNESFYDSSEVVASLQQWPRIQAEWDDRKSNEIQNNYYARMKDLCEQLIELSFETQDSVNAIVRTLNDL
jgi:hypothetical protein